MRLVRWSYSKLKAFMTCPRQFYYLRILKKYPREETEATRYGTAFHEVAENYILHGTAIPEAFQYASAALEVLAQKPGDKYCELGMGITQELKPCADDDPDAWWVGYADYVCVDGDTAWVVDYKTGGKPQYADKGQLEQMAMAIFLHFPYVKTVRAGLLFVLVNAFIKDTYTRERRKILWQKWLVEYGRMVKAHEADVWNPKTSGLCRKHCQVEECDHNGRVQ